MTEETIDAVPADATPFEAVSDAPTPRFALAVPAGLAAALIGAVLWALFVYLTEYQFGLVVILIGALIGYVIRVVGRGTTPAFGILGALCSALAWAFGTALSDVAMLAKQAERPFVDVLGLLGPSEIVTFAIQAADIMDLVFLAIAVWEGYKFSIHRAAA